MAKATTAKRSVKKIHAAAKRKPAAKRSSAVKLCGTHTNHGKHLCELVRRREMLEVAKLAKGAKYVCSICGRAAAQGGSLCEPVRI